MRITNETTESTESFSGYSKRIPIWRYYRKDYRLRY